MSNITENTIIINNNNVAITKLKRFLKIYGYDDSLKEIYKNDKKVLLTFDFNGEVDATDEWKDIDCMLETEFQDGEIWTRINNQDIDDTIQSQIQKGLLFSELHNDKTKFEYVMNSLEYALGGLHGSKLLELKNMNNIVNNLTKDQKDILFNSLKKYDKGDVFRNYKSKKELIDDIDKNNNIIGLAYTTSENDKNTEYQTNFNLSTMSYEHLVVGDINELLNTHENEKRDFYDFCEEISFCEFNDMLQPQYDWEYDKSVQENKKGGLMVEIDKELELHEQLKDELGQDEYLKALWYMEQNDLTISDVLDSNGNLKTEQINDYYASHDLPTNEDFIKYFDILGDKISGLSEFIRNLNKSKDGKDRVYTSIKSHTKNM